MLLISTVLPRRGTQFNGMFEIVDIQSRYSKQDMYCVLSTEAAIECILLLTYCGEVKRAESLVVNGYLGAWVPGCLGRQAPPSSGPPSP